MRKPNTVGGGEEELGIGDDEPEMFSWTFADRAETGVAWLPEALTGEAIFVAMAASS